MKTYDQIMSSFFLSSSSMSKLCPHFDWNHFDPTFCDILVEGIYSVIHSQPFALDKFPALYQSWCQSLSNLGWSNNHGLPCDNHLFLSLIDDHLCRPQPSLCAWVSSHANQLFCSHQQAVKDNVTRTPSLITYCSFLLTSSAPLSQGLCC